MVSFLRAGMSRVLFEPFDLRKEDIMKDYTQVATDELIEMIERANETGLFNPEIRYKNLRKEAVYTNFIDAIYNADENENVISKLLEYDEDIINFYNSFFEDEVEKNEDELEEDEQQDDDLNDPPPLNFDNYIPPEDTDDDKTADQVDIENIPDPEPDYLNERLVSKPQVKPLKTITKLSKVTIQSIVDEGILRIWIKEPDIRENFSLPDRNDKQMLKAVRKKVMNFIVAHGATVGQKQAVSKTLNLAGYYMR